MTVCELPKASSSGDVAITRSSIPCELEFAPRVAAYLGVAACNRVIELAGSESSARVELVPATQSSPLRAQLPRRVESTAQSHGRVRDASVRRGAAHTAHAAVREVLQEALGGLSLAGARLAGDDDALALCVKQAAVRCRANPVDVRARVCTCRGRNGWERHVGECRQQPRRPAETMARSAKGKPEHSAAAAAFGLQSHASPSMARRRPHTASSRTPWHAQVQVASDVMLPHHTACTARASPRRKWVASGTD